MTAWATAIVIPIDHRRGQQSPRLNQHALIQQPVLQLACGRACACAVRHPFRAPLRQLAQQSIRQ
jgi:hypothetical protein